MRLVYSATNQLRLLFNTSATVETPIVRNLGARDVDRDSSWALRGSVADALECFGPKVLYTIATPDDTTNDALKDVQCQVRERVYGVDGTSTTALPMLDLTPQLLWTAGLLWFDLKHAFASSMRVQLTNRAVVALALQVRVEVYATEEPVQGSEDTNRVLLDIVRKLLVQKTNGSRAVDTQTVYAGFETPVSDDPRVLAAHAADLRQKALSGKR